MKNCQVEKSIFKTLSFVEKFRFYEKRDEQQCKLVNYWMDIKAVLKTPYINNR
jgi:hypothetical protein